jgi:hypothetical protein
MRKVYDFGIRDGKDAAAAEKGFSDVKTESPSHLERAKYCDARDNGRLNSWEREFIDNMLYVCTCRRSLSQKRIATL